MSSSSSSVTFINRSICLYCKASTQIDAEKEFHDIFDEIGLELQLPNLVEKFFRVNVGNVAGKCKQLLCDDCVNRLIELFDLAEHCKEAEVQQHSEEVKQQQQLDEATPLECQAGDENNEDIPCNYSHENSVATLVEEAEVIINDNYVVESSEIHYNVDDDCEASVENDDQQFYAPTDTDSARNEEYSNQLDYVVDVTHREADVQQHSENDTDHVADAELEHHLPEDNNIQVQDYIDVIDNDGDDDDDGALLADDVESQNTENTGYEEVILEEQFENVANEYFQLEENQAPPQSNCENIDDVVSQVGEYYEEYEENTMDVIEENVSDDIITIEEEYLIEETICSEEYDSVDLVEYLDSAIITKFEDLDLSWTLECKLCLQTYNTFQELLKHSCVDELINDQRYCCILKDCNEVVDNIKSLARHLLTTHHDNIESLPIYGRCPECQKTFSNIADLNKHACGVFKRKAGVRHWCPVCNMDFQSQKRYVFHMQFHLTKHRPKICLLCGTAFNNIMEFFEHVNYNHEPVSAMACIKCDRFFKEKTVYDRHVQCHESKTLFECSYCPKSYTNRCGLTSHMEIYHNHSTKPMQCEYCNKEFVSQTSYRSHMKIHMPEANVPACVCSICGLISNTIESIKNHIEANEEESLCTAAEIMEKIISIAYTCENCSLDFFSARQLHQHRQLASHNCKLFYCPICRKSFRTLQHMRNHMTNHKDYDQWNSEFPIARFYMCDIGNCRDAYPLWTSLYYHKKRHKKAAASASTSTNQGGGDQYKCQFCEKLCPTKMSLAIHVARVHNNSHVKCTHCKKMYKTDEDLKQHVDYMHTSIQCTKCQKLFKNRRNLISHEQLVHKNEKRYFCGHCSKGYYYKSEMEAHEKNVHPDISYKCDLCHFITNYAKSLDIHMAKHNNQLQYKCSKCPKAFGRKQLLSVHEKRHEKYKHFVCYDYYKNGCDASFLTHFLLKKHIQRKHADGCNHQEKQSKLSLAAKRSKKPTTTNKIIVVQDENTSVELIVGDGSGYDDNVALQTDDATEEYENDDDEYEIHYEYEDEDGLDDEVNDDDQYKREYVDEEDVDMDMGS